MNDFVFSCEIYNHRTMKSINPYTQKVIKSYVYHSQEEVAEIAKASSKAFGLWKRKSIEERAECLYKLADILRPLLKQRAFLAVLVRSR